MTTRHCQQCDGAIIGRKRDARYCSKACRQRAYELRHFGGWAPRP